MSQRLARASAHHRMVMSGVLAALAMLFGVFVDTPAGAGAAEGGTAPLTRARSGLSLAARFAAPSAESRGTVRPRAMPAPDRHAGTGDEHALTGDPPRTSQRPATPHQLADVASPTHRLGASASSAADGHGTDGPRPLQDTRGVQHGRAPPAAHSAVVDVVLQPRPA